MFIFLIYLFILNFVVLEIEHKVLTHTKHTPTLGQDLKSRKELKWIKQLYQKGQRSWVLNDAGCLRTEGIIALEEGLCRAVESGADSEGRGCRSGIGKSRKEGSSPSEQGLSIGSRDWR